MEGWRKGWREGGREEGVVSGILLKKHGFFLPVMINTLLCSVTLALLGT